MPQMTHSKPIKKAPLPQQTWLLGFEQYRQETALFPHSVKHPVKRCPEQTPVLPGFKESKGQSVAEHRATFPMLKAPQKIR